MLKISFSFHKEQGTEMSQLSNWYPDDTDRDYINQVSSKV
jgi:hypothetical protein